jgi:hypothetical protein
MANPRVILETTAEDHGGFPLMLWKAVCHILANPARPRYVVLENSLPPAGREFQVDVHINSCPLGTSQAYLIHGRSMPTLDQALQVAAWEGLVRLRYAEPAMAQSRAFQLLPVTPPLGVEPAQIPIGREVDPAVITLVTYGASMTRFFHSLMAELIITRRHLGRAHLELSRARNPPPFNHVQAQETGQPFPDDLLDRSLDASVAQVLARAQQQPQEQGVILEGVPAIPHPAEDGDVDTTLRLGHATPTSRGRQTE